MAVLSEKSCKNEDVGRMLMYTSSYAGIASFYNQSTYLWEKTWGQHMHHGYYGKDGRESKDHLQAQIDLIDEALKFAGVTSAKSVVDVGCGIGGSSRYLAKKFGAKVKNVELLSF